MLEPPAGRRVYIRDMTHVLRGRLEPLATRRWSARRLCAQALLLKHSKLAEVVVVVYRLCGKRWRRRRSRSRCRPPLTPRKHARQHSEARQVYEEQPRQVGEEGKVGWVGSWGGVRGEAQSRNCYPLDVSSFEGGKWGGGHQMDLLVR